MLPEQVRETNQDIAEGATNACLKLGAKGIKNLAQRFLSHDLIFIEDESTIDDVKEQIKSIEWGLYDKYVKDKNLRILIKMGLTLRKYEERDEKIKLKDLRDKIVNSDHGTQGLHIAQFVQNHILKEHIISIIDKVPSLVDAIKSVEDLLKNLETRVTFVQQQDNPSRIVEQIKTRLMGNCPGNYIVFARDSALNKGNEILESIKKQEFDYSIEIRSKENRLIIILHKRIVQIP